MNENFTQKTNLLDLSRQELQQFLLELGEKSYRTAQLLQWIHQEGKTDFTEMSNLSKIFRNLLAEKATITAPTIALEQLSDDGTRKWLLRLADGNCIETVFIPEVDRGTLCVSSQVGCMLNCSFCSTAHQGFNRNLSVAEIIGQVWIAARQLSKNQGKHDRQITNVVMMGMGEPLLNFDNVVKAMDLMQDDYAYGLSKYRVTLSTAGVVPTLQKLAKVSDVALAVSLHAPNDELRNMLVPLNKKYPLKELLATCRNYFPAESKRKITMEYVMLEGVNDTPVHARELIQVLQGIPCKVNLIPFNPFPQTLYKCSSPESIDRFRKILQQAGINTITRKTRGDDIDAACGQLAGKVADKTNRSRKNMIMMRVERYQNNKSTSSTSSSNS